MKKRNPLDSSHTRHRSLLVGQPITREYLDNNNKLLKLPINEINKKSHLNRPLSARKTNNKLKIINNNHNKRPNSARSYNNDDNNNNNSIDNGANVYNKRNNKKKYKKKQTITSLSSSTINVIIRIRPLLSYEIKQGAKSIIEVNDQMVIINNPKNKNNNNSTTFAYDYVLNHQSTTLELYNKCVKKIIIGVIHQQQHGTIFAYGATGSGKTHTMTGNIKQPGIIVYTVNDIFNLIDETYSINVSYIEIYNEEIRDLLCDKKQQQQQIELREDPEYGVILSGVTKHNLKESKELMNILEEGGKRRTTSKHNLNEQSSRSHSILMINIQKQNYKPANLFLIDLAGSERAKKAGTNKKQLREGAKINRSLLALANVINALGSLSHKKGLYIPFRDSKLTRLLKESLCGAAQTVMICNVTSASTRFYESRETLIYANRAKNIKVTKSTSKKRTNNKSAEEYERMLQSLRNELKSLKENIIETPPIIISPINRDIKLQRSKSTHEIQELESLTNQFQEHFQEQIQYRVSLAELDQQTNINKKEMTRLSTIINLYEEQHVGNNNDVNIARDQQIELMLAMAENAVYKKRKIRELKELENDTNNLIISINNINLKDERKRVLTLSVERCVLELQKMELELQQRTLKQALDSKTNQVKYYEKLLKLYHINFVPYDKQHILSLNNNIQYYPLPKPKDLSELEYKKLTLKSNNNNIKEEEIKKNDNNSSFIISSKERQLALKGHATLTRAKILQVSSSMPSKLDDIKKLQIKRSQSAIENNDIISPILSPTSISIKRTNSDTTTTTNNNNNNNENLKKLRDLVKAMIKNKDTYNEYTNHRAGLQRHPSNLRRFIKNIHNNK